MKKDNFVNKQKKYPIYWSLGVIIITGFIVGLALNLNNHKTDTGLQKLQIGNAVIYVEVAATPAQKELGLSNRASLRSDGGMIFIFTKLSRPTFWMKNMNFPLDFIWVRDKKVVELTEHVGAPLKSMADAQLPLYIPTTDVDAVIEVNAGFVEYYKIKVGDEVK
jgi:uncharacterized membrane protein (UPF0127 family)